MKPLLHFLLIGGLLWAAERVWFPAPAVAITPLVVDDRLRARVAAEWQRDLGRPPTADEREAAIGRALDEERLVRAALAAGLDRRDSVVRARLMDHWRFAFPEDERGDLAVLRQARRLGLAEQDGVIRRRLVQVMGQRLLGEFAISEAALMAFIEAHPARYRGVERFDVEQRYFGDDEAAARAAYAAAAQVPGEAPAGGIAFPLGNHWPGRSEADLVRQLGPAIADVVANAAGDGRWLPPVASPYGWHLLRVTARHAPPPLDLDAVRTRAAYAWLEAQEPLALDAALAPLRLQYPAVAERGS